MEAFSPASSKVDLVEAAEAHAQKLHQLAINLSGCVAPQRVQPGCLWVQLALSSVTRSGRARGGEIIIPKVSRLFVVWGPHFGRKEQIKG